MRTTGAGDVGVFAHALQLAEEARVYGRRCGSLAALLGLVGGLLVGALLEVLLGGGKVLREECASHLLLLNESLLQLILGCTNELAGIIS